ncbi:MAG: acetyl-CoA decarbonylase/synthase complex subunit delta [Candidatus Eremiobacteraeota bacterium]|nr:acetyl-CoA decarbonylase/synthase complex subunit delta [Candidatus Eremiobacteraeota bacterium]
MCALAIKSKLKIETVKIGAMSDEGGTRSHNVKVGGQSAMPFLFKDGVIPNSPVIAYEFQDVAPVDWPTSLGEAMGEVWSDPVKWAEYICSIGFPENTQIKNNSLLFLRLMGAHPDRGGKEIDKVVSEFRRILDNIKTPLIVIGCGVNEIDRKLMPKIAREASGEKLLIGNAVAENYKELTDCCIKYGHSIITESPIDINIAKQANILVQDAGLPGDRIVMYATTGALGYGMEYAYSIMERTRLAGLQGDRYMNKPQIAFVGQESWRVKEANKSKTAGVMWEYVTSLAYLHAGADIVVLRHPESGRKVAQYLNSISK